MRLQRGVICPVGFGHDVSLFLEGGVALFADGLADGVRVTQGIRVKLGKLPKGD